MIDNIQSSEQIDRQIDAITLHEFDASIQTFAEQRCRVSLKPLREPRVVWLRVKGWRSGWSRGHFPGVHGTDLEAAFNDRPVFDAAKKIDLRLVTIRRGETNGKRLLGFQWQQKLDCAYAGKVTVWAPFSQSSGDFIENHYARHDRRAREMSGQAGMISGNRAANLKVHLSRTRDDIII